MKAKKIFDWLWIDYVSITPSALKVHQLLEERGEIVENDHIAFRTVDLPKVNIEAIARVFQEIGYVIKDEYHIVEKRLYAVHLDHPLNPELPKIFISQLRLQECSGFVKETIEKMVNNIPQGLVDSDSLIFSGRTWGTISYQTYQQLREESEYAAWLYVFGYRANHFTVNVNRLKMVKSLEEVNLLLKSNSFKLNESGGEIKGGEEVFLSQSSILADLQDIEFKEGNFKIPSCYYEFALRHEKNGELFRGFVGNSANKIFESTDLKLQS